MNFRNRSYQQELLDRDDIPFADIRRNMQRARFHQYLAGWSCHYLGGFAADCWGINKVFQCVRWVVAEETTW